MSDFLEDAGFEELINELEKYSGKAGKESVVKALETGAKALMEDVASLPKPRSAVAKGGYTHLLDTVTYRRTGDEVETGWGKYYGPMVEKGTVKMNGIAHMAPTYERNRKKYEEKMKNELFGR